MAAGASLRGGGGKCHVRRRECDVLHIHTLARMDGLPAAQPSPSPEGPGLD